VVGSGRRSGSGHDWAECGEKEEGQACGEGSDDGARAFVRVTCEGVTRGGDLDSWHFNCQRGKWVGDIDMMFAAIRLSKRIGMGGVGMLKEAVACVKI
jgi:hypothetical protein